MIKYKIYIYFIVSLFVISLASASSFGYDYLEHGDTVQAGANYSINVNNSNYLEGHSSSYFATASGYIPYTGANQNIDLGNNTLTISNDINFTKKNNGTELFYINSSTGRVGIGTDTPVYLLDVDGLTIHRNYVYFTTTSSYINGATARFNNMLFSGANPSLMYSSVPMSIYTYASTANYMKFSTNDIEAIRILGTNQYVGIGTTNPQQKLHVNGTILANGTINATSDIGTNGNLKVDKNVNITGNLSVKRPYGMFSSTESQNITSANTPFPITFNWTEDAYQLGITDSNTNFTFQDSGDYLIELSAIVNTLSNNKHVQIWVQKNGINVPRSNTRIEIENAGTDQIIAVPFILDVDSTTDKFRFMMASDDLGTILVYTTNTSYSPESPSIIMTITKISEVTD